MALPKPVISNVNGTNSDAFRIGSSTGAFDANGVLLDNNSTAGRLKLYKSDGTTRAELEVATPTQPNSAANKSYVDVGPAAAEMAFSYTLGFGPAGNTDSTVNLPQNAKVTSVDLHVTAAFTGGTPAHTLTVGYAGSVPNANKFAKTTDSSLGVEGIYTVTQFTNNDTPDVAGAPVRLALANGGTAPTAGSVTVVLKYVRVPTW